MEDREIDRVRMVEAKRNNKRRRESLES